MGASENRAKRTVQILKAFALGPALAGVGYLSAVLIQMSRGPYPTPFSHEFHAKYSGLWTVLGAIGFVLGLASLVARWRSRIRHGDHDSI